MDSVPFIEFQDKTLRFVGGNCKSSNIIYLARCVHCTLKYFGKTTQTLRERISGHRTFINSFKPGSEVTDENCLAAHVKSRYGVTNTKGFKEAYKFSVVEFVSTPGNLLTREQKYINSFRTFSPFGLNIANPIGLRPILLRWVDILCLGICLSFCLVSCHGLALLRFWLVFVFGPFFVFFRVCPPLVLPLFIFQFCVVSLIYLFSECFWKCRWSRNMSTE